MRIRNRFVSNSSSSSFIIVVKKSTYEEAIKKLTSKEKEIIEQTTYEIKAFGLDLVAHSRFNDAGGHTVFSGLDYEEYEDEDVYEALENYESIVNKIDPNNLCEYIDDGG
jgi:hypothetical protein